LQFHPSQTTQLNYLTEEKIEQFNRDGFVQGIQIFSPERMEIHRRYVDHLLAQVMEKEQTSYSIS